MASNNNRWNTHTTTTTNTTTYVVQSRRPHPSNQGHQTSSSTSSHIPLVPISSNNAPPHPADWSNNNTIERFPSLPAEPPRLPPLSQVQTQDHYPLSATVSLRPSRTPITTVSTQVSRGPVGIKRLPSHNTRLEVLRNAPTHAVRSDGRRRSESAPQRPIILDDSQHGAPLQHSFTNASNLGALVEGQESAGFHKAGGHVNGPNELRDTSAGLSRTQGGGSQRLRRVSDAARSAVSRMSNRSDEVAQPATEYDDRIVDMLDILDPEVSTLNTLTNVQNSLFVPDLGRWLNRRPTYELTQGPSYRSQRPALNRGASKPLPPTPLPGPLPLKDVDLGIPSDVDEEPESPRRGRRTSVASLQSIASVIQDDHYAVLPHGVSLEGWSEEDKELLDDHVRHMLHSKREGFKRSMRAFGKYVRKPLGFLVTLYAVLITLFGLAWVLFLIGWIYVGERQLYVINVIDYVLVALFAIVGDGLAPFRAVDTYHMCFVAYYHHLTEKIRKQRALPKLQDHNELPEAHETEVDVEASLDKTDTEFSVLSVEQQKKLEHHQAKFSKSHSFYKPHETTTHHAFPHHLFVAIVLLLDLHSCLQIALGATTWGIDYRVRPAAITPTILCFSITANITAGILIKIGDNKTRKKDVFKRMFRQELTEEAMKKVERQKELENSPTDYRSGSGGVSKEKDLGKDVINEESSSHRFSRATTSSSPSDRQRHHL